MTTELFLQLKSFKNHKGNALVPNQIETAEWLEQLPNDSQIYLKHVEARDIKMHGGYFKILGEIHDKLPKSFKDNVKKNQFYKFIKIISKEYDVIYSFKDGREFIEYKSISFGKMNQENFRKYFANQLSVIYEEILIPFERDYIMDEINDKFEKLLSKLY